MKPTRRDILDAAVLILLVWAFYNVGADFIGVRDMGFGPR